METMNLLELSEIIRKETNYDPLDYDINNLIDIERKEFFFTLTKIWEDAENEDDFFYTDSANTWGEKEEAYEVFLYIISDIPTVDGRIENTREVLENIIVELAC